MCGSWNIVREGQTDGKSIKSIFQTQGNSLWDEKQRFVNQILLSKLWYIGKIYTILKFIKE